MNRAAPAADSARQTATESLFDSILADIVRGTYPPGSRLPAERDLARQLGASRPTLREALRRLSEWRLVESRRGSGVLVRPIQEWSIEVVPAYLRYAKPGPDKPAIPELVADLLALRRELILQIVELVAGRLTPGDLEAARAAARRAWEVRGDSEIFPALDLAVMRSVVEAAGFLPAVWMLNRMAGVYLDIARTFSAALPPPEDYLQSHDRFLDALGEGDTARARAELRGYLERHDDRLRAALGDGRGGRRT